MIAAVISSRSLLPLLLALILLETACRQQALPPATKPVGVSTNVQVFAVRGVVRELSR